MAFRNPLTRAVWEMASHTRWRRYLYHRYDYDFSPPQLAALIRLLDEALPAEGCILEVGCAYGHTTVFLNRYLDVRDTNRRYVCVDTFSGFTPEDARVENEERGMKADYTKLYSDVSLRTFRRNLEVNGINRVQAIEADVNDFDFAAVGPIAFALLDVDLYRPMKRAIPECFERLSAGGIIACDDCDPTHAAYSGAGAAYLEFVSSRHLKPEILEDKLGILRH